ncbi:MAG: CPBP family intramembrane metalloprotease [Ktedonobacteraceae bacterium]|nr:CPBP family intramembrane metalloprotease [Ktedonobacteraceae bacterium]
MTQINVFIKRHPVLTFYILVFALSWGPPLIVFGFLDTGALLGTGAQPILSPFAYLAMLPGALIPALAGLLVTGLISGRAGLRDLRSRLFRWRVSVRWYAVALLTAPLLMTAILFALSLTSRAFLPAIITAGDKTSLLVSGLVVGLVFAFFEEVGWMGFATPEIRKRNGLLTTGLIVGLLWGALHLPLFAVSASSSGPIPPALYVVVALFSWLPAYRVLMVWVYDQTRSVLVAILMHLPIIVGTFVLLSPAMAGIPDLTFNLVFGAMLWVIIAGVALSSRRKLLRGEHASATPLTHNL